MGETAKYCAACAGMLSPATIKSEKEQEFFDASQADGSPNPRQFQQTTYGTCEKCGTHGVVDYFLTLPRS